jgi:STE24 endopeptidase
MTFVRRGCRVIGALLLFVSVLCGASMAQPASGLRADPVQAASTPPGPQQAYTLPPDKAAKAIELSRIRNILEIIGSVEDLVVLGLLLATGAFSGIEAWAVRVFRKRWMQGLLFFVAFFIVMALTSAPIDALAHHFSLQYGISVQGWSSWLGDQGKSLALAAGIGSPVLLLFNWIVRKWPRRYWFAAWLVCVPLIVLGTFVEPLGEPLFNKFEPLSQSHAELVEKLELVVARTGMDIPPSRMFLMKASEKTNGLNAYVDGIGATKRIVVWDTTAGRIPDDEVMFIFGHESGHYVLNHIPKQLSMSVAGLLFVFWACAGFAEWMANRFGVRWGLFRSEHFSEPQPPPVSRAGFTVLIFALSIAGFVSQPVVNAISRHYEHEADVYGQEAIHGLVPDAQKSTIAAFNALGDAWLEDPNPSPFIEFWLYNHPSLKVRANFAAQYDPWRNGGRGEFFKGREQGNEGMRD